MSNYSLEIVSRDKRHNGKVFKPYDIDGRATIGVSKKEPFEIRFRNNSWNRVQVRFSMDGTDILTGEPASTEPTGKMWLVEARASMTLKAWPESNSGGARFVFGEAGKSVAVNTHGNVEGMGVIAAAVFVEGAPIRLHFNEPTWISDSGKYKSAAGRDARRRSVLRSQSINFNSTLGSTSKGFDSDKAMSGPSFDSKTRVGAAADSDSIDVKCSLGEESFSRDVDYCMPLEAAACCDFMETSTSSFVEQEPGPAIGAGEYVKQELTKAAGLEQPKLDRVLELQYKWWSEVRQALTKFGSRRRNDDPNPFPGDEDEQHIDLSYTPRQRSTAPKPPRRVWAQYL